MLFDDTYLTVSTTSEAIFRDKGSKFIGYAFPLKNEAEVKTHLLHLKAEHGKARHFCWAFRIGQDRNSYRINDDGEPSGTAGRPILNTLLSADLTYTLIVVVRYFGGTLLGVPGLINAYKTAATESLKANKLITKTVNDVYEIEFNYVAMNAIMSIIKDEKLITFDQEFGTACSLKIEIRKSSLNAVIQKLEKAGVEKLQYLYTI